tara:strand:- start:3406 stop:3954 length:549 start_codon:yes stop_codon:yes gene_type:complete
MKQGTICKPEDLTLSDLEAKVFEHWLENQDTAVKESFFSFAADTYSLIQVYLYSRFLGYKGSITSCDAWFNTAYQKPDHLAILLNEIQEMQEDIRKLREDIENYAVKRDSGVARIAAMQKELRSTIAQVESFVSSRDRKGLLMTGADRAMREIISIFRDDPIEGPLHEASMSVWARIQYEED